jgi:hypothetical protein
MFSFEAWDTKMNLPKPSLTDLFTELSSLEKFLDYHPLQGKSIVLSGIMEGFLSINYLSD